MSDLLYAVEIWLLVGALVAWFYCRAAIRLREGPLDMVRLSAEAARLQERGLHQEHWPEPGSLIAGVRIYDRA